MSDKEYRFILVGAGGVGSFLVQGLVRMLEWKAPNSALIIIDGDNYEEKNKERQAFKGAGNKAEVLALELAPEFPLTMVIPQPLWVVEQVGEDDEQDYEEDGTPAAGKVAASTLLCEGDVVYAVVDNDAARRVLFEAARNVENIDVFTGGNDDKYFASVTHYRRRNGKDVTRNPVDYSPEYANPADRNPGDLSCQERAEIEGGTQLLATNMTVAALLLAKTNLVIFEDQPLGLDQGYVDLNLGMMQFYDRSAEDQASASLASDSIKAVPALQ